MISTLKRKIKKEAYNFLGFKRGKSEAGTLNERIRVKWLEETLKKIPSGFRILDAGAGELQFKKFCTHLNYVSQDFAQYDGSGDNKGLQMNSWDNSKLDIVSDITSIPVENGSFDAVMCTEVLEHVPDPVAALKEISRVLRPGGFMVVTAPFSSLTHFSPFHFSTGFNRYFYERHLDELGYQILDISENGNYFEFIAQELRRVGDMAGKYANSGLMDNEKVSIDVLISCMDRLSKKGDSSKEILCFGYHIFAKKNLS